VFGEEGWKLEEGGWKLIKFKGKRGF